MKAIAWDDEPEDYLTDLARRLLNPYNIVLEIESEVEEFIRRAEGEDDWDFVITDLLNRQPEVQGRSEHDALRICNRLATRYPVFLISGEAERALTLAIPPSVIVKSKDVEPRWMAREIRDHLQHLGIPNRRRVFMTFGHDQHCRLAVEKELIRLGVLQIEEVIPADVPRAILDGVLGKMRDCAAIVALCTSDDELKDKTFSPRQNVLLEMGMALSLPRGPERLIIIQQKGTKPAKLPSDLGGHLVLSYEIDVSETFAALAARLKKLRVALASPQESE